MKVSVEGGSLSTLASGQSIPIAIAIDGTSVYWLDLGSTTAGDRSGSLLRLMPR